MKYSRARRPRVLSALASLNAHATVSSEAVPARVSMFFSTSRSIHSSSIRISQSSLANLCNRFQGMTLMVKPCARAKAPVRPQGFKDPARSAAGTAGDPWPPDVLPPRSPRAGGWPGGGDREVRQSRSRQTRAVSSRLRLVWGDRPAESRRARRQGSSDLGTIRRCRSQSGLPASATGQRSPQY
jgi:hypothetical protein